MSEPDRNAAARESLERLTAALQVAVRVLVDMTDSSREACVALDTIERILSDGRESLRALVMEGARSAPASPADAAYFSEVRSSIEAADDERTCRRCGDQVAYLSTDDLCDGCVEAGES